MKPLHPHQQEADQAWQARAACAQPGVDLGWWYDKAEGHTARARRICGGCPVRAECLADAERDEAGASHKVFGVRGGLTAPERVARYRAKTEANRAEAPAGDAGAVPVARCARPGSGRVLAENRTAPDRFCSPTCREAGTPAVEIIRKAPQAWKPPMPQRDCVECGSPLPEKGRRWRRYFCGAGCREKGIVLRRAQRQQARADAAEPATPEEDAA